MTNKNGIILPSQEKIEKANRKFRANLPEPGNKHLGVIIDDLYRRAEYETQEGNFPKAEIYNFALAVVRTYEFERMYEKWDELQENGKAYVTGAVQGASESLRNFFKRN